MISVRTAAESHLLHLRKMTTAPGLAAQPLGALALPSAHRVLSLVIGAFCVGARCFFFWGLRFHQYSAGLKYVEGTGVLSYFAVRFTLLKLSPWTLHSYKSVSIAVLLREANGDRGFVM